MKRFAWIFLLVALPAYADRNPMAEFNDAILSQDAQAVSNTFVKAAIAGQVEAMITDSHPEMLAEITEMAEPAKFFAEKIVPRFQPVTGFKFSSGKIARDEKGKDTCISLWTGTTKDKKKIVFLIGAQEIDRKVKVRLVLFDDQAKRFFNKGTVQ